MLEEQEGSVNFKFGVLYAAPKQTTDDEMFSNGKYLYPNLKMFYSNILQKQHYWTKWQRRTKRGLRVATSYQSGRILTFGAKYVPFQGNI